MNCQKPNCSNEATKNVTQMSPIPGDKMSSKTFKICDECSERQRDPSKGTGKKLTDEEITWWKTFVGDPTEQHEFDKLKS